MIGQAIGAGSASVYMASGVKPHSDGLEPPRMEVTSSVSIESAQTNAADIGFEASEPRRDSQTGLDVVA